VFEEENALQNLAAFASQNGPAFYGLPVNTATMTLTKQDAPVAFPNKIPTPNGPVTVFDPGYPVYWNVT
jgi:dihydroorotase